MSMCAESLLRVGPKIRGGVVSYVQIDVILSRSKFIRCNELVIAKLVPKPQDRWSVPGDA